MTEVTGARRAGRVIGALAAVGLGACAVLAVVWLVPFVLGVYIKIVVLAFLHGWQIVPW